MDTTIRKLKHKTGAFYLQKDLPTTNNTYSTTTFVLYTEINYNDWFNIVYERLDIDMSDLFMWIIEKSIGKHGFTYRANILCVYTGIPRDDSIEYNESMFSPDRIEMLCILNVYERQKLLVEVDTISRNSKHPNEHPRLSVQLIGFAALAGQQILQLTRDTVFIIHAVQRMSNILLKKAQSIKLPVGTTLSNHFTRMFRRIRSSNIMLSVLWQYFTYRLAWYENESSSSRFHEFREPKVLEYVFEWFKRRMLTNTIKTEWYRVSKLTLAYNNILNGRMTKFEIFDYCENDSTLCALDKDLSNPDDRAIFLQKLIINILTRYREMISMVKGKNLEWAWPHDNECFGIVDDVFEDKTTVHCMTTPMTVHVHADRIVNALYQDTLQCAIELPLVKCFFADEGHVCDELVFKPPRIIPQYTTIQRTVDRHYPSSSHSSEYAVPNTSLVLQGDVLTIEQLRNGVPNVPSIIREIGFDEYCNRIPEDHTIFLVRLYDGDDFRYGYFIISSPDLPVSYHTLDYGTEDVLSAETLITAHAYGEKMMSVIVGQKYHVFFRLQQESVNTLVAHFKNHSSDAEDWIIGSNVDRAYNDICTLAKMPVSVNIRDLHQSYDPWIRQGEGRIIEIDNSMYKYWFVRPKYYTSFLDAWSINKVPIELLDFACTVDFMLTLAQ